MLVFASMASSGELFVSLAYIALPYWWPPSATYPPGEVRIVCDGDDDALAIAPQAFRTQRYRVAYLEGDWCINTIQSYHRYEKIIGAGREAQIGGRQFAFLHEHQIASHHIYSINVVPRAVAPHARVLGDAARVGAHRRQRRQTWEEAAHDRGAVAGLRRFIRALPC